MTTWFRQKWCRCFHKKDWELVKGKRDNFYFCNICDHYRGEVEKNE